MLRLGYAPLIVGGKTALSITRDKIEESVSSTCKKYEIVEYSGSCNDENAEKLAQYAKEKGLDVIVGVGLLLQNFFNGETENNDFLLSLMKKYGMPCSLGDIGIEATEETKKMYYEKLSASSAIENKNDAELAKLRDGLDYLWRLK